MIDIHPGTGQLHLVARLQMTKTAEPRQQPAHGQGRRRFHAQDVVFAAQRVTGALQRRKAFTHPGQQQPGSLTQLQTTAIAHEQPAGKVLFQGTNVSADGTLGNR
ncbi:hypothetical protein D3C79_650590 [compost metagenome]